MVRRFGVEKLLARSAALSGKKNRNANKYPGFYYDNLGRFVYVELKKKF